MRFYNFDPTTHVFSTLAMSWGLKTHIIYYSIFASPLPSIDFNNPANFRRQSVTNVICKRVKLLLQERPSIYDAMTSSRNHSLFGQVRLSEYSRPGPRTGKGWPLTGETKLLSRCSFTTDHIKLPPY